MIRLSFRYALLFCAALYAVSLSAVHAQPLYKFTVLGTSKAGLSSQANGINSSGYVVGATEINTLGQQDPFVWSPTYGFVDLGIDAGALGSAAAINDSGFPVGVADTGMGMGDAFLGVPGYYDYYDIYYLEQNAYALSVNGFRTIVGQGTPKTSQDFLEWSGPGPSLSADLPPLKGFTSAGATSVNDYGYEVGYEASATGLDTAVYRKAGALVALKSLGGSVSRALAVNNSDVAVGYSTKAGSRTSLAAEWANPTTITQLPTLAGYSSSVANAINSEGAVVGQVSVSGKPSHGVIYISGTVYDLNKLIANSNPPVITNATGINDLGQVSAVATINGVSEAILLTPVVAGTVVLGQCAPGQFTLGYSNTTVTVNGTNFTYSDEVTIGGKGLPTTYHSPTTLTATLTPTQGSLLAGYEPVSVVNPATYDHSNSIAMFFPSAIQSSSPGAADINTYGVTLTVLGGGFTSGSVVTLDGSDSLSTTFVSPAELSATVDFSTLDTAASHVVTVVTGGVPTSTSTGFAVVNPKPMITRVSPNTGVQGTAPGLVTITGLNFVGGTVVVMNGQTIQTNLVSSNVVTADFDTPETAVVGKNYLVVQNPAPGGGTSNKEAFTVSNPVPAITSLSPAAVVVNSPATQVTVTGTGFNSTSVAYFGATAVPTTLVASTELTISLNVFQLSATGTTPITVVNSAPGGGTSNAAPFTVTNGQLAITSVSPSQLTSGGPQMTLVINGLGFVNASVVNFNNVALATTFVSANQLTAVLPAADYPVAEPTGASIDVTNPGGAMSNVVNEPVN